MSDTERAHAFIVPYLGFDVMESATDIETLTAEFAAVRRDERAAVVAELRPALIAHVEAPFQYGEGRGFVWIDQASWDKLAATITAALALADAGGRAGS